ncbi:MAG: hypothetical protein DRI74_03265 [Bacteroidetes bacterium]|nr:MAG: hypothetical protein DRI74_03265 [Bacteroidota bacterium]
MKTATIIFLSFWISFSGFAQGQGRRLEMEKRYRTQKIAFITDRMQLSVEEAQNFWPLYRELEAEKAKLASEIRDYRATFPSDAADMTEEQAMEFLNYFNKHTASMSKLVLDYQQKFLKVISAKQLLLLQNAENGFRRHLLQEFRGRGGNHRNN